MSSNKTRATKAAAAVKALNAELLGHVATVAISGFQEGGAYRAAVAAVVAIIKATRPGSMRNRALEAAATGYKSGRVANALLDNPAYAKRWHNFSDTQMIEAGTEIILRAAPTSSKDDRRTDEEHKACRAADVSWVRIKEKAGIKDSTARKNSRKPRPSTVPAEKAPPVDLVKASPRFDKAFAEKVGAATPKAAANDYFATAAAALLATVDKNAKLVDPRISTAVHNFLTEVKAALGIKSEK